MCTKDRINEDLDQADLNPRIKQELKIVVEEIAEYIPTEKTRGMMYDLVHVVLEMDERIRDLESRVYQPDVRAELSRVDWSRTRRRP